MSSVCTPLRDQGSRLPGHLPEQQALMHRWHYDGDLIAKPGKCCQIPAPEEGVVLTLSGDDTPPWLVLCIHFLISDSNRGPGVGGFDFLSNQNNSGPCPYSSVIPWVNSRSNCPGGPWQRMGEISDGQLRATRRQEQSFKNTYLAPESRTT